MNWLKKSWKYITGALVFLLASLLVTSRRKSLIAPAIPPAPKLDDVKVPDVNTAPADTYEETKTQPETDAAKVVDNINERFK